MYKHNDGPQLRARGVSAVRRGGLLAAVALMLGSSGAAAFTGVFAGVASADALNPLTERSLKLTSSAPGYSSTDGSGNATYAQPGQGANGQKTGQLFSFRVSTDSSPTGTNEPIKAMTFQYCKTAAGNCLAPGNNGGGAWNGTSFDPRDADTASTSDLRVVYATPVCGTDFIIRVSGSPLDCTGWTMVVSNEEDSPDFRTGENNFITLANATSTLAPTANTPIQVEFVASDTQYITNPGFGPFFAKINTYTSEDSSDHMPATDDFIIDGGVTVANMMTNSIWIQTKVLETMNFSVGKSDPNTSPGVHGACDNISDSSPLMMGDVQAENSLSAQAPYDAYSYWRLSSNSSSGASVYYSGATLSNTVGDQIDAIGTTRAASNVGSEQFGLAIDTLFEGVTYDAPFVTAANADANDEFFLPTLNPLAAQTAYAKGDGTISDGGTAEFAFDPNANDVAALLASDNSQVLECTTARMRYLANIAGYTPAGIYTTKINYLAAPQY